MSERGPSHELIAMRKACRERAKGELQAMLYTYFNSGLPNCREGAEWEAVSDLVEKFIRELDDLTEC